MTYRFVVYDIEKSLKKTFDDTDISLIQIIYWVQVVVNKIRIQHYLATKTDLYTSTYSGLKVKKDAKNRPYIDLPTQIMELQGNGGIVYVGYELEDCNCNPPQFMQVLFNQTSVGGLYHLMLDEYTKPSPKNPYYYRIGDKVDGVSVNRLYFAGFECAELDTVEVALLSTLNPSDVCDLDEEIPLPNELVHDVIREVLSLGRFVMMIPEEAVNQGSDNTMDSVPRVPGVQMQNQNQNQVENE